MHENYRLQEGGYVGEMSQYTKTYSKTYSHIVLYWCGRVSNYILCLTLIHTLCCIVVVGYQTMFCV